MKKILCIIFFSGSFVCGFSQSKKIDSLKQLLNTQINDTTKVRILIELSNDYFSYSIDSFSHYTIKALQLSLINGNFKLANVYNHLGMSHIYTSRIDSAHYYFDKALQILDNKDDRLLRSMIYGNYATSFQHTNDYEKKIEYNSKAINLVEDNDTLVSRYYYNQAVIFGQAQLNEQSKKYFKLAFNSSQRSNNIRFEAAAIRGLAYFYGEENKLDSASIYLKRGLELCEITKSPETCFGIKNSLGRIYDQQKKFDEADILLLEAKEHALALKNLHNIMAINMSLGEHEFERGNYKKSARYFQEFDDKYTEYPAPSLGITVYRIWSEIAHELGDYKKSNRLLKKYLAIKDSVYSKENKQVLADVEAKYETEKKNKELAEQQLKLERQGVELQKKKAQYGFMTGAVIFLLMTSLLGWFLYQQRQKRKNQEILTLKREQQVQTLESLMEGEEKERYRIAKELHDGVNVDLSAIKYKLTSLLEKNNEVINEAVQMIDKSCEQVRAISHNLVPPSLKDFSLIETIGDFCATSNGLHAPEITFNHIGEPIHIAKKAEVNIFRIVQELVNNSIKHAHATEVNVQISHRDQTIQLTVEDNGVGFDKNVVVKNGIGLQNVQSRVEYLNAKLDFSSNEKGTSYIIDMNTEALT